LLHSDVLDHFYRTEQVELEEPKGNFTSVAVCGMSGEFLGPPSHHSYQTTLHKIHRERFAHLSFEDYKRRVRTDNSPEAVQKWKDSQKHGVYWVDLVTPPPEGGEPERLKSRAEMEAHFRKKFADGLLKEVTEARVAGNIARKHLSPALYHALRQAVDDARKHLLQTAQLLCTGFERLGLKLFKRRGGKLWVSRNRPRALDGGVVLSTRIAKIVDVIKSKAGITFKELIETVAPSPPETAPAPVEEAAAEKAPVEEAAAPAIMEETGATPVAEPEASTAEASTETESEPHAVAEDSDAATTEVEAGADQDANASEAPETPAAVAPSRAPTVQIHPTAPPAHHELTAEQMQVLKDLHWLNSEGYIIEYADGVIFIGVTEPPPPKPKPVKEPAKAETAPSPEAEVSAAAETTPAVTEIEEKAPEAVSEVSEESPVLKIETETETEAEAEPEPEAAPDHEVAANAEAAAPEVKIHRDAHAAEPSAVVAASP
jgi:hypothetical protein